MSTEAELKRDFPHLNHKEIVDILEIIIEAYKEMKEVVNFLVEQVLRGRMEGIQIDKKVEKALKDFRIGKREIDNNLSDYWQKLHEVMYPEKKEDGY